MVGRPAPARRSSAGRLSAVPPGNQPICDGRHGAGRPGRYPAMAITDRARGGQGDQTMSQTFEFTWEIAAALTTVALLALHF
jgi:hypothetical protein